MKRALFLTLSVCLFVTAVVAQNGRDEGLSEAERKAPANVRSSLVKAREQIRNKRLSFRVGLTGVAGRELRTLAGTLFPANFIQAAKEQNAQAAKILNVQPNSLLDVDLSKIDLSKANAGGNLTIDKLGKVTATTGGKKPAGKPLPQGITAKSPHWDWRIVGVTVPIRKQKCANCWAYATQALYELAVIRQLGYAPINTSEQFLVSNGDSGNCTGGYFQNGIRFLQSFGSMGEDTYPDTGTDGTKIPDFANLKPWQKPILTYGFANPGVRLPTVDEIKKAIVVYGPVAVSMNATEAFKLYTDGVFDEDENTETDHAVVIIGWDDSKSAWIVRNSWGNDWGNTAGYGTERGYAYIKYGSNLIGTAAAWVVVK